jgi:hypothetical protein
MHEQQSYFSAAVSGIAFLDWHKRVRNYLILRGTILDYVKFLWDEHTFYYIRMTAPHPSVFVFKY